MRGSIDTIWHQGCQQCDEDDFLCPLQNKYFDIWRRPGHATYVQRVWSNNFGGLRALDEYYNTL